MHSPTTVTHVSNYKNKQQIASWGTEYNITWPPLPITTELHYKVVQKSGTFLLYFFFFHAVYIPHVHSKKAIVSRTYTANQIKSSTQQFTEWSKLIVSEKPWLIKYPRWACMLHLVHDPVWTTCVAPSDYTANTMKSPVNTATKQLETWHCLCPHATGKDNKGQEKKIREDVINEINFLWRSFVYWKYICKFPCFRLPRSLLSEKFSAQQAKMSPTSMRLSV